MTTKTQLLGVKIRLMRGKLDVSQEYCARKVGCTLRTWRRWEHGESYPLEVYRPKIIDILPELVNIP